MGTNNPDRPESAGARGVGGFRGNASQSVSRDGRDNDPARPGRRAAAGATSKAAKARARILLEWLGGVDPPDPARNIHQPAEYLDRLLKSIGVADGIDEERLKEVWEAVAGQFVARHTVPESLRNGVLVLRVLQPTMKFHLQQMSGQLLANLHRELGKETVRQVTFKIG